MTELRETILTALHDAWWRGIREKIEDSPDGHVERLTDAIMQKLEGEQPVVTVKVSRELLAELTAWSEPVQVKIEQVGGEYDMIFRRHDCPIREAYGRGLDDEAAGAPIPAEMGA